MNLDPHLEMMISVVERPNPFVLKAIRPARRPRGPRLLPRPRGPRVPHADRPRDADELHPRTWGRHERAGVACCLDCRRQVAKDEVEFTIRTLSPDRFCSWCARPRQPVTPLAVAAAAGDALDARVGPLAGPLSDDLTAPGAW